MKKYIKKISIFIILLIISLTAVFYVKADSGWDSDYGSSDWGDSYDSGEYDYDNDSSWSSSDYDSNYDNDYSTSNYSYRRNDNTKVSKGTIILGAIFLIFFFGVSISIILFPQILSSIFNKKKNKSNIVTYKPYRDLNESSYYIYFKMYKEEFKNKINKHFIDVQESWMNFDYDNLRKLCTDELYNQYKTQLEILKLKNEQNIMSDFSVKEVSIYDVKKVNNIIEISVYLDIKFRDYVINTNSNKVVRGDKNIYFNNSYELTFVMSNNNKITKCPSCGAEVEVVSSNLCPYCKNTIVQTSNELVLSKKKIVSSIKTHY